MKILIIEPGQHPRRADIPHSLENLQQVVGGCIQAIYPFPDPVAVICDEEGLLKGYELNRAVAERDIICGTFFICGLGEDDFTDLPDELADKYEKQFYHPEAFARTPKGILVISADGIREVIL